MFNKKKEDVYIAVHRFGRQRILEGKSVTQEDYLKFLEESGYDLHEDVYVKLYLEIFGGTWASDPQHPGPKRYLSAEAYFNLVDYDELQEARHNSRQAWFFSIIAIILSIIAIIAPIVVQQDVVINDQQLDQILQAVVQKEK